jgi:hypothetical protein
LGRVFTPDERGLKLAFCALLSRWRAFKKFFKLSTAAFSGRRRLLAGNAGDMRRDEAVLGRQRRAVGPAGLDRDHVKAGGPDLAAFSSARAKSGSSISRPREALIAPFFMAAMVRLQAFDGLRPRDNGG